MFYFYKKGNVMVFLIRAACINDWIIDYRPHILMKFLPLIFASLATTFSFVVSISLTIYCYETL